MCLVFIKYLTHLRLCISGHFLGKVWTNRFSKLILYLFMLVKKGINSSEYGGKWKMCLDRSHNPCTFFFILQTFYAFSLTISIFQVSRWSPCLLPSSYYISPSYILPLLRLSINALCLPHLLRLKESLAAAFSCTGSNANGTRLSGHEITPGLSEKIPLLFILPVLYHRTSLAASKCDAKASLLPYLVMILVLN